MRVLGTSFLFTFQMFLQKELDDFLLVRRGIGTCLVTGCFCSISIIKQERCRLDVPLEATVRKAGEHGLVHGDFPHSPFSANPDFAFENLLDYGRGAFRTLRTTSWIPRLTRLELMLFRRPAVSRLVACA